MPYHLLTGATGLLGAYLLRDCLLEGIRLAVVVRPTKALTARQRIEAIMARWDEQLGYALPRPAVLTGNLTQEHLGLEETDLQWIADHCDSVIHNAASLTFVKTRDGEPFRSNVDGTRNVLDVCSRTGIRNFHHVSTAYVSGLRTGRVLETELDVGHKPGNVYEESKIQSEKMVVESDAVDSPTVFRPGIIIGDSRTGYTSTFHGFYSPLRIAQAIVGRIRWETALDDEYALSLLKLFQLRGDEYKSFVPVDWIAAVMTHVISRAEHHGKVYHLTPSRPVQLTEMTEVMFEAVAEDLEANPVEANGRAISLKYFEEFFREQLKVYQAYWRNDAEFDRTNTEAAAHHLPCPDVDRAMLERMCRFAIKSKFGFPPPPPMLPALDVQDYLRSKLSNGAPLPPNSSSKYLGLQVNGDGGGQWELEIRDDRAVAARVGLSPQCETTLYLNSNTFQRLVLEQTDFWRSIQTGRMLVEGNAIEIDRVALAVESFLGRTAPGNAQSDGK